MPKLALPYGAAFIVGVLLIHVGELLFDHDAGPSTILYGKQFLSSLGALVVSGSVIGIVAHWLSRRGIDGFSLAIFVASGLVSLHYFHHNRNNTYTNDWLGHFHYAQFMSRHLLSPFDYRGPQDHHPPLYYYLAGLVIAAVGALHTIPVITALHFLSWSLYQLFNAFGLLILYRAGLHGRIYRASKALLLFWPAGIHLASSVNSGVLFYGFYAAGF